MAVGAGPKRDHNVRVVSAAGLFQGRPVRLEFDISSGQLRMRNLDDGTVIRAEIVNGPERSRLRYTSPEDALIWDDQVVWLEADDDAKLSAGFTLLSALAEARTEQPPPPRPPRLPPAGYEHRIPATSVPPFGVIVGLGALIGAAIGMVVGTAAAGPEMSEHGMAGLVGLAGAFVGVLFGVWVFPLIVYTLVEIVHIVQERRRRRT